VIRYETIIDWCNIWKLEVKYISSVIKKHNLLSDEAFINGVLTEAIEIEKDEYYNKFITIVTHFTETELKEFDNWDYTIHNTGTLLDLKEEVISFYNKITDDE
jgi:hypothetical protein